MNSAQTIEYYGRELERRLRHYLEKRRDGFRYRGSLENTARDILVERADSGFISGGHFEGIWPRDICFAAKGISTAGFSRELRETADWMLAQLDDVFYTDFHTEMCAATPAEGVDTFPALVIVLANCNGLSAHALEIRRLAALYRERFFDEQRSIVTGTGSSWWDSASEPREAYNTAMLLAALERLDESGIETTFTGEIAAIREGWLSSFWIGTHVAEHRNSSTLACDANVVPLYFGLFEDERARAVIRSLRELETGYGVRMRSRPFSRVQVHPFFLFHHDYHYHIWPWNSLMYALGLRRYGYENRARRERERIERTLQPYGNFLEILTLDGEPYMKRGYASAEDFTVAAALWVEYVRENKRLSTG